MYYKFKACIRRRPTFAEKPLSSALEDFTSVFGMRTGGTPLTSSPYTSFKLLFYLVKLERTKKTFISSTRLNPLLDLHLCPINPVIFGKTKSSNLEACFALICFQRLSVPDLATQQCPWRDSWYTSGQFSPILSYKDQLLSKLNACGR